MTRSMPSPVELKVVGLTFYDGYPETAYEWRDEAPVRAKLKRQPKNKYDKNAVAVFVEGRQIGHLQADMAKRLAPEIDDGVGWKAEIVRVEEHPDHPEHPSVWLSVERQ